MEVIPVSRSTGFICSFVLQSGFTLAEIGGEGRTVGKDKSRRQSLEAGEVLGPRPVFEGGSGAGAGVMLSCNLCLTGKRLAMVVFLKCLWGKMPALLRIPARENSRPGMCLELKNSKRRSIE